MRDDTIDYYIDYHSYERIILRVWSILSLLSLFIRRVLAYLKPKSIVISLLKRGGGGGEGVLCSFPPRRPRKAVLIVLFS